MAQASAKTKLRLAATRLAAPFVGSYRFGTHGRRLWSEVTEEMPHLRDPAALEMLAGVCRAVDQAEALHEIAEREGLTTRAGQNALRAELSCRGFINKTLHLMRKPPKRPGPGKPPRLNAWDPETGPPLPSWMVPPNDESEDCEEKNDAD